MLQLGMRKLMPKEATLKERLDNGTEWQPNGCLLWVRATDSKGYGVLTYQGKTIRAHVAAWLVATGEKPASQVDHRCFVHACCNVAHLRGTTPKQNNEHLEGARSNSKTGIRGVTFDPRRNKYRATVVHNYRQHWCGYHDTAEAAGAAAAAKRAELFTHDDGAPLAN